MEAPLLMLPVVRQGKQADNASHNGDLFTIVGATVSICFVCCYAIAASSSTSV